MDEHEKAVHPALGSTDVRAGALCGIAFEPMVHLHYAETVLPIKDGLTKLKDFPAKAGRSGQVIPEQPPRTGRKPHRALL